MKLLHAFNHFIDGENLFASKDRLLLAVSGGMDSVVLTDLCSQSGYDFEIAHCNFQLRGTESDRDEQFVRNLAQQYGKPFRVKRFDTEQHAALHKVSIQVAARELRYAWLHEILGEASFLYGSALAAPDAAPTYGRWILTAHHQDDNIETMLMNFFKGTGIAGLRGMQPRQDKLVRPLLFAKKEMLEAFARSNHLQWVEDSSNHLDKYTRNYFRHQVIPLVKKIYPEAEDNLADNLQRFKDIELLYRQAIEQHKKKLLEYHGHEVHIPVLKLQKAAPAVSIWYEIIKTYGFSAAQATASLDLLQRETGRYIQSATHRIIRNRSWLIIAPLARGQAKHLVIDQPGSCSWEEGELELVLQAHPPFTIPHSSLSACLDADMISFPLLLRKWRPGDYFYPLGMRKKKKLARFFIDQKLSATEKERVWVLESGGRIIWVVGQRIDDRCRITGGTVRALKLTLKKTVQV